jgi:CRISPR/Cas system CSM-associated protein Csm2 small subunit
LHIETVKEISKIKELVDSNMREMRSKKKTLVRVEQEAANIVKSQMKRIYDEVLKVEKAVTDTLKSIVAEKLKRF